MEIQKKHNVLAMLIAISLVIGGLMTAGRDEDLKKDILWQKVTSQKDPAFSFYMPNLARHTVAELPFDKQKLKTASIVSDDNGREYLLNITAFPKELDNLPVKDIFNFALKLLMPKEDYILIDYKPSSEIADFKIVMKTGAEIKRGRMTFKNGFLFLQMVTSTEANFFKDDYEKFIESLKL